MANVEAMAKANEKRLTALEKKLDAFEKDFRKSGDVLAVVKRIATLEAAVKALAVTSKSAGGGDAKVVSEIGILKDKMKAREQEIASLEKHGGPAVSKKVENLQKRKDVLEKTLVALNGRTDRDAKAHIAAVEKINKDLSAQAKKIGEATMLEARLKTLEALVQAALAK